MRGEHATSRQEARGWAAAINGKAWRRMQGSLTSCCVREKNYEVQSLQCAALCKDFNRKSVPTTVTQAPLPHGTWDAATCSSVLHLLPL